MSEKLYYRLVKGLVGQGEFYPVETSPYDILEAKDLERDVYKSIYYYNEQQVNSAHEIINVEITDKATKEKKIVSKQRGVGKAIGADGTRYDTLPGITNKIVFDFDSGENPDIARRDTIELINRLGKYNITPEEVSIYYSGGKGTHLIIETNEWFTSSEMKSIAMTLAKGILTADTTVYNDSRIIRLPHSKHQKSGRYCTPIYMDDLVLSMDEIVKIGSQTYTPDRSPKPVVTLPTEIIEMKTNIAKVEKRIVEAVGTNFEEMREAIAKLDFSKKLPNMPPAKWVLHMGFIPRGWGQEARMILAATYKAMMLDDKDAWRMLKSVSERRVEITGDKGATFDEDELWLNVIDTVYSSLWQGGSYGISHPLLKAIDGLLPAYLRYDRVSNIVVDKDEAFSRFVDYAKNVDKNTISFGIKSLDKSMRIMTKNVYGFLAAPSVGKTSVALQILENTSQEKNKTTYFSFDMSLDDTYEKILIRHTGKDGEKIMEELKSGDKKITDGYKSIINKYYENVDFVFKPGMTIDDMRTEIVRREEETGVPTKLVVVDYLTLIKTPGSDGNQKAIDAIQGLRYLAHDLNLAVFVLIQPNKENATPDKAIKSYNGIKGSSEIAEACTAILTGYREGFDPQSFSNDNYLTLICVKNRKGRLFSLDFNWKGKEGLIREMEGPEREHLAHYREMKKEELEAQRQSGRGGRDSGKSWY